MKSNRTKKAIIVFVFLIVLFIVYRNIQAEPGEIGETIGKEVAGSGGEAVVESGEEVGGAGEEVGKLEGLEEVETDEGGNDGGEGEAVGTEKAGSGGEAVGETGEGEETGESGKLEEENVKPVEKPTPVPKPIPKPIPEPVVEPAPEPAPEPIPEPIPEPVPEPQPTEEAIVLEYTETFTVMAGTFEAKISALIGSAVADYNELKDEDGKVPKLKLIPLATKYIDKGYDLEKACDAEFYGMLDEMEAELTAHDYNTDAVDQAKETYKAEKKARENVLKAKVKAML